MRLVAKVDVDVAPEQAITSPTLTYIADGVPTIVPATSIVDRTTGREPLYKAVMDVPAHAAATLAFHFRVVDGYEGEASGFVIQEPDLKLDVSGCTHGAPCERPAGVETANVSVRAPAGFKSMKLLQTLDGQAYGTEVTMTAVQVVEGITEWRASAATPAKPGAIWSFQATTGDYAVSSDPVTLTDPGLVLDLVGCTDAICPLQAGVGKASLTLTAPKGFTDASLLQFVDGTPLSALQMTKGPVLDGKQTWSFAISTLVHEGTEWRFKAVSGDFQSNERVAQITRPPIAVQVLDCPSSGDCALVEGKKVLVSITAPRDISPASATLKATLDSVPDAGFSANVTLDEVSADVRTGYYQATVPHEPGKSWRLRALINESASPDSGSVTIVKSP